MCKMRYTQLADDEDIICPTCKKNDHIYDIGFSIYIYTMLWSELCIGINIYLGWIFKFFAQEAIKKLKRLI